MLQKIKYVIYSLPIIAASFGLGADVYLNSNSNHLCRYVEEAKSSSRAYVPCGVEFIRQHKGTIVEVSRNVSRQYEITLPPEMIAGVILAVNYQRTKFDDVKDFLATGKTAYLWDKLFARFGRHISRHLGYTDPTVNSAQVKLSTVKSLDEQNGRSPRTRENLERMLQDPDFNIGYAAMALADLLDEPERLPPSPTQPTQNPLDNPHLIAVIGTEYFRGPTKNTLNEAKPSDNGRLFALFVASQALYDIFGDDATITPEQRLNIIGYLLTKA